MKHFELMPHDRQKSYYGKATVLVYDKFPGKAFLQSYSTIVCGIVGGEFKRYWTGYSATTQKHINSFRILYGMRAIGKAEWLNTPVSKVNNDLYPTIVNK